jgi:hypothetical protein
MLFKRTKIFSFIVCEHIVKGYLPEPPLLERTGELQTEQAYGYYFQNDHEMRKYESRNQFILSIVFPCSTVPGDT